VVRRENERSSLAAQKRFIWFTMPKNPEITLAFVLTLIVFLGGLWIYWLRVIIDLTTTEPTNASLLFFGFMHFVELVFLILGLWVFYLKAIENLDSAAADRNLVVIAETIFFGTWPVIVAALVISYAFTKIAAFSKELKVLFLVFYAVVAGFLAWMYFAHTKNFAAAVPLVANWEILFLFLFVLPIGFLIYLMLISPFLADVEIKSDKEFYKADETITICVRSRGYLLRPSITRITCGLFEVSRQIDDIVVAIAPEKRSNDHLLRVDFRPQVIPFSFHRYHYLKFAPAES
jgi:hypothetical protein